jgi:hypothetical protein
MEVAAGLIKLKPDSRSKVDEWRDTMKSRMEEALAKYHGARRQHCGEAAA